MVFTWKESLCLGVINYLKDPELVRYFSNIAYKKREKYVEKESREFHCSLRVTKEDRWKKTKELKEKGLYCMMSPMVPITCPIPFTNSEWGNGGENLRNILYFREGFMKKIEGLDNGISVKKNQLVSEKIKCLNKYMKYSNVRKEEYDEAVYDFMLFNEWRNDEYPYLLLKYDHDLVENDYDDDCDDYLGQPLITIIG